MQADDKSGGCSSNVKQDGFGLRVWVAGYPRAKVIFSGQNVHQVTSGFTGYSYDERLKFLNLERLELRRVRFDVIWCYKILFGLVSTNKDDLFELLKRPSLQTF